MGSCLSSPTAPARRAVGFFFRSLRSGRVHHRAGGVDASPAPSGGVRVQFEGVQALRVHAFSFVRPELVSQPVRPLNFSREATLIHHPLQRELPLLCRLDGPSVVPPAIVRAARTYRQAVRLCKALSPRSRITLRQLAEEAGLPPQHVSDYLNPDDGRCRRDLPGDAVAAFERALGNTAVSQWHALQARLTVLEEMQAERAAA
jgi:AraC-like DNA-binding protein